LALLDDRRGRDDGRTDAVAGTPSHVSLWVPSIVNDTIATC
jgi:hypothetical protein